MPGIVAARGATKTSDSPGSTWGLAGIGAEQMRELKCSPLGFPGGAVVENLPANAGDTGSSPGLGRSHMPRSN